MIMNFRCYFFRSYFISMLFFISYPSSYTHTNTLVIILEYIVYNAYLTYSLSGIDKFHYIVDDIKFISIDFDTENGESLNVIVCSTYVHLDKIKRVEKSWNELYYCCVVAYCGMSFSALYGDRETRTKHKIFYEFRIAVYVSGVFLCICDTN